MTDSSTLRDIIWSRRQIEGLIAEGRKIIILDGQVIKSDAWLPYHPGGDKAILHMVGRDGTDEIRALHSQEAQQLMQKYVIGRIEGRWTNFLPPIRGGHFRPCIERDDAQAEDGPVEGSSSSSSTTPSTPIFDPIDSTGDGLRQRRETDTLSMTSASSVSLSEVLPQSKESFLDTRTTEEIAADLRKYPSLTPSSQDAIIAKYRALNSR